MYSERMTNYFPGPNFWHAKESPDAPEHFETSGVVQPPIHATAALYIYRYADDAAEAKAFLEYAFSKLRAWHDYLYRERDPEDEGLVYIRHPWESGMDNSPVWDQAMQRMHLRADQIPATTAPTYTPSPPRTVRPAMRTTASPTWSDSSPTAPTTRRR